MDDCKISYCPGCKEAINDMNGEHYLQCSLCTETYDLLCASMTAERYLAMDVKMKESWQCQSCKCNARIHVSSKINTPATATKTVSFSQSPPPNEVPVETLLSPFAASLDIDTTIDQSCLSYRSQDNVNAVRGTGARRDLDWTYTEEHCSMIPMRLLIREEMERVMDFKLGTLMERLLDPVHVALRQMTKRVEAMEKKLNELAHLKSVPTMADPQPHLRTGSVDVPVNLTPATGTNDASTAPRLSGSNPSEDSVPKEVLVASAPAAGIEAASAEQRLSINKPDVDYATVLKRTSGQSPKTDAVVPKSTGKIQKSTGVHKTSIIDKTMLKSMASRSSTSADVSQIRISSSGDNDGRRQRPLSAITSLVRGTAAPGGTALEAADRNRFLHLFYLKSGTTEEQVTSYINSICGGEVCRAETLKAKGDYASFKLCIPTSMTNTVMCSENWATDVCIKPWRQLFRTPKENSKQ